LILDPHGCLALGVYSLSDVSVASLQSEIDRYADRGKQREVASDAWSEEAVELYRVRSLRRSASHADDTVSRSQATAPCATKSGSE
jgi:hypothetical protein